MLPHTICPDSHPLPTCSNTESANAVRLPNWSCASAFVGNKSKERAYGLSITARTAGIVYVRDLPLEVGVAIITSPVAESASDWCWNRLVMPFACNAFSIGLHNGVVPCDSRSARETLVPSLG